LVDDVPDNIHVLMNILKDEYALQVATNGMNALESAQQEPMPDLILLDIMMPEMDGFEVIQRLKSNKITKNIPVIFVTALTDVVDESKGLELGAVDYITKPVSAPVVRARIKTHLTLHKYELELERKVVERTEELRQTMGMLEKTHDSLKKSFTASIKVMSNIIEMRENIAPGHSRRVAELASKLAKKVGLSVNRVQQVLFAGLLHNIGKIGMTDKLLKRAYEDMSKEEFAQFVKHPVIGQGMLMAFEELQEAAIIIRSQHERYDGKGFPDQLQVEDIPIGARILAIASDYETFQIGTITSQKQGEKEALDFLTNNRKTRYDPNIVILFHEMIKSEHFWRKDKGDNGRQVVASRLVVGMILAEDVLIKDKVLVLPMGHVLDNHTIERLTQLERSVDGPLVIKIFSDY